MSARIIAFACEATDATIPDARLIELAAVAIQAGRIVEGAFHTLINPQISVPPSGTHVHRHTNASLADCPNWTQIAPQWMAFTKDAHMLVWHAEFHLSCLNREQARAGLPSMQAVAARITDLRETWPRDRQGSSPSHLETLLGLHRIRRNPERDGPMKHARQLAQLWLAAPALAAP